MAGVSAKMFSLCLFAFTLLAGSLADFNTPNCQQGTVIVHLFNWKWTDIADECERFLGPRGYCGVQVSPPHEHLVTGNGEWWERYQPVSYLLESRSGTDEEFRDMVSRCSDAGVNIYVDAVINHMSMYYESGTGSGGSDFEGGTGHFPGVPYDWFDFNSCEGVCSDNNCEIDNYQDASEIRNCRLGGLMDLALGIDSVRDTIRDYLNNYLDMGVAGFRVDACKHMWPGDIEIIYSGLNSVPFIYNEVIDLGGEAVSATEYTDLGRVTEFKYSQKIGFNFRGKDKLAYMVNFGEGWGFLPDGDALVFVDNHDNQRGHGAGGADILSFQTPKLYKLANAYMLAWPYGFTRVMSSYEFSNGDQGPPSNSDGTIKDVPINDDDTCGDGWVCEHRWRQIYNMVEFRNVVDGTDVEHWWDNGNNQIAFSRGNKGFIAINNDNYGMDLQNHYIGLPDGDYCDVISGRLVDGACTGHQLTVSGGGYLNLFVPTTNEDPMFAFHECSKIGSDCALSHD